MFMRSRETPNASTGWTLTLSTSRQFEWNLTPRLRREIRRIIFEHFDQIVAAWREHFGGQRGE